MDVIIFSVGLVVGIVGVLAIQFLYKWIAKMYREINDVKNQLSVYTYQFELWYEFQEWKRMNKKEKLCQQN